MTFAEKLLALRRARGWSQEELAAQVGVSRQALSKWENGAAMPDAENILAIAKLFGVTTDYLLIDGEQASIAPLPAPRRTPAWRLACRIAGVSTAGVALIGLLILGILSSVFPADYAVSTAVPVEVGSPEVAVPMIWRRGLDAFLRVHNLGWLFALCIALVLLGILTIFLPNLVDMRNKLKEKWDNWGES